MPEGLRGFQKGHPQFNSGRTRIKTTEQSHQIRMGKYVYNPTVYGLLGKKEYNRKWQKDNPELTREYALQYYYRRFGAEGKHTLKEWLAIKGACRQCNSTERIERDHIIPISKGGSNNIENIQPLCRSCNAKKSAKVLIFV